LPIDARIFVQIPPVISTLFHSAHRGYTDGRMQDSHRLRILIVEDEFVVALAIERTLEALGHEPIAGGASIEDALRGAETPGLDGALLDVNILGGPVWPAAQRLVELGVPILLVTGYGDSAIDPAWQHLPRCAKPFDEGEIVRFVGELPVPPRRYDMPASNRNAEQPDTWAC
jgi:DNA-binding LytR/AlgR family response regulator